MIPPQKSYFRDAPSKRTTGRLSSPYQGKKQDNEFACRTPAVLIKMPPPEANLATILYTTVTYFSAWPLFEAPVNLPSLNDACPPTHPPMIGASRKERYGQD